jgi:hypothetical protein
MSSSLKPHLAIYKKIAAFSDDRERLAEALRSLDIDELVCVTSYLIKLREKRDLCNQRAEARCRAQHGCSSAWFYDKSRRRKVQADPEHPSVEDEVGRAAPV